MKLNVGTSSAALSIVAETAGIPVELAAAIICVESSGETFAWNPEPQYRYLWNVALGVPFRPLTVEERTSETPPTDFPSPAGVDRDAEFWGQQASWGLMQIMGAVARERGFTGRYLPELCDPSRGLLYGCRHLKYLLAKHGVVEDAVAAYNAGSPRRDVNGLYVNQGYVDKVIGHFGRLKDGTDELA